MEAYKSKDETVSVADASTIVNANVSIRYLFFSRSVGGVPATLPDNKCRPRCFPLHL